MSIIKVDYGTISGGSKVYFGQNASPTPAKIQTDGKPKRVMISLNFGSYLETEIFDVDADPTYTYTTLYYNGSTPSQRSIGASNSFIGAIDDTGVTITNPSSASYFNYMIEV